MSDFEKHYSVRELAEVWGLSHDSITRLFRDEPGVFVIERPGLMARRRRRTLRIPQSVAERVYRRLLIPAAA